LLSKISGSPGNVDVLMLMDMSFMLHRDLLSGGAALALHLPHRVHLHGKGAGEPGERGGGALVRPRHASDVIAYPHGGEMNGDHLRR
jgi:hypothetical protein